ncbi:uncharacterized protein LOC108681463 [Hyalella azteca]|uniref:Uncharacterized protein LOC108681463 n=1 Tax=Hyalella azteca TaxID=294128 RepID=A0A8B7PIJ7_HYAAZ|nr:uncharacterized protein LOC108681463 [Hyalella azteca]
MKYNHLVVLLLSATAVASAWPTVSQTQYEFEPLRESQETSEGGRGWQTWNALVNWLRPATNYITQRLPNKTPSEFASDVRDTAVDLRDRAAAHPVVQGVGRVVRPVHEWVSNTASELSKTSFRDMYDGAMNTVRRADETVADWLNRRGSQQQLSQYNYDVADGVEQVLH